MTSGIGIATAFVATAFINAASASAPSPSDIVGLDYAYVARAWDLTCLGYSNERGTRRFDQLFGVRMRRIDAWAAKALGTAPVEADRRREFPDGFVLVGGCRINSETGEAHDPVPDFAAELRRVEQRIRASESPGRIAA